MYTSLETIEKLTASLKSSALIPYVRVCDNFAPRRSYDTLMSIYNTVSYYERLFFSEVEDLTDL